MKQEVKRYRLNRDFGIECVMGERMAVRVILISVIFEPVIEHTEEIKDKDEANRIFKEYKEKYKDEITFAEEKHWDIDATGLHI